MHATYGRRSLHFRLANVASLCLVRFAEHEWYMQLGLGTRGTPPWGREFAKTLYMYYLCLQHAYQCSHIVFANSEAFMEWWSLYNESHPEYFALQPSGKRGPDVELWGPGKEQWTKMCVSQPNLWQQIVNNFEDHVHSGGVGNHSLGVSACEDDFNGGYCQCSKCRAWDAGVSTQTGRLSDRYARFWSHVYAEMARRGHGDKWVSGYAYAAYTDPPKETKLEGNILILSVGFGDYPALPNETTFQRQSWSGWHAAGAKAMALRPNSLWDAYSTAPYVVTKQLVGDLVFTGKHGLFATDFDSNVGNYHAVGATYYILARSLRNPASANISHLEHEFFSAYGGAADEMQALYSYWENWTNRTFTSPQVRARIAELHQYPDTGNGRSSFIMIPELYTDMAIAPAEALLAKAVVSCGSSDACSRVRKMGTYMKYLKVLRAAVNATNSARALSKEDAHAGWWTQTVYASDMVTCAKALATIGLRIRGEMIVNVIYTFAKATERGDLFGLAAARDVPQAWSHGQPLYLLPTQHWALRFDPHNVGNRGPSKSRWWALGINRSNWTALKGPHTRPWSAIPEMAAARGYSGVGWYAASINIRSQDLKGDSWTVATAGATASNMQLWVDGVQHGHGCATRQRCERSFTLGVLPTKSLVAGIHEFVVRVNATGEGGMTRRLFFMRVPS